MVHTVNRHTAALTPRAPLLQVEAMCASNAGAPLLCVGPDPPLLTHYTSTALALEVDDSLALGDESPSAAPRSRPSTSADDDWEVVAAAT